MTLRSMTPVELAWFTGLYEGEGSVGRKNGIARSLCLAISMTDEDIVRRAHALTGVGYTAPAAKRPAHYKPAWTWRVSKGDNVVTLLNLMLPLLGHRRRTHAENLLRAFADAPLPRRLWTACKHGHPLSGPNLRVTKEGKYTKRRCRVCELVRAAKWRARRAAAA